jgi:two-component system, NtrC family, sensor histidine kinase HydH
MLQSDRARVLLIVLGIALVSLGHYFLPPSLLLWHNIFQRLYYLPIVFAAVAFGWPGGVAAAACSMMCYLPHIAMTWRMNPAYSANQYAEIMVFFLVGIVTGTLADRERKRRQELQKAAEQLSRVYRELQDSFEQLKRADRLAAIGQLAASLAHEIRNPLGSIEGAIDILERNPESESKRDEFLPIMKKECNRLRRLLTNLLNFARPRQPQIRPVNVRQVIDTVCSLARHSAERQDILLKQDLPDDLPDIKGDEEQLQQVILNLALNAIQAMSSSGEVLFSARPALDRVVVRVRDQGDGIASADLDRIFDPFYTTKENGTGLGLAVAHQIVEQHGGSIRVERNPDRGTTFTLELPRHNGQAG